MEFQGRDRIVDADSLATQERSFADTAAIIKNLDLVITSCTSIAHLSGALGTQTWIALNKLPDWRWQLHGDRTPWYPNVHLFRQQQANDWHEVFIDLRTKLETIVNPTIKST